MEERKLNHEPQPGQMGGKGHGRQGNDKAPGEETAEDLDNVVADTQRGKNKVDGDPSKESDRPAEQHP